MNHQIQNPYVIAEIAQAHDGSLGIAHSYIDALADTGVNAIKFQTHIAEAESSIYEPFRINFSYEDTTRMDYWKRMEFTEEQWHGLKKHCDEKGLEFLSSPFSNEAVALLDRVGVKKFKVGSGEVTNFLLLECIAKTGKDIILSSGMSSFNELDAAINFLKKYENNVSILQCTTSYPTLPDQWGLNVIQQLNERYSLPVGFSDHSGDIYAGLAAVSLGAKILEFHVVFDKKMFGPDASSSLTLSQVTKLMKGIEQITEAFQNPVDKYQSNTYTELKNMFGKSLAVNKDLPAGHIIKPSDLETKKPRGRGVNAEEFNMILGKKLKHSLNKWDFLSEENIV